jgi:D-alanyl-D-alanine carboxypeptidase/D-alanyl-D-alanine-endopeptidase (penicillin-binding protein 4)
MRSSCFFASIVLPLALSTPADAQTIDASAVVAAQALAPPKDVEARKAWLKARIDEAFSAPAFARAKISAAVMDPESGKLLYAKNDKTGLNAASNVKIVTEAASLALLGPEFRWKTSVLGGVPAEGKAITAGELHGDLYVKTSGDPTLSTQDLNSLAASLAAIGLRKIRGGLVLDTTAFDGTTLPPAFEQKNDSAAFRAVSSAASLNGNVVTITITPAASAGSPARIVLDPPSPALVLAGTVTTAAKGPAVADAETADAGSGQTRVTVSGRILLGSEPRVLQRRIVDPESVFAQTFKQILGKRGITIEKGIRIEAVPKDGARVLAVHESPTLAVVVHDLGKRSSNFAAEQLLRTLGGETGGRPGSWQKGLDAVARYLEGIGIPRASFVMKNGSGLYDSNQFSAEQLVLVLRAAMRDFRIASEFLASLAVGGADGTLAHRMGGSLAERYVRAKTGTLANVSCLSGIVGAPGSKPLIFSILMNDLSSPLAARAAQDRITVLLVAYLDPGLVVGTQGASIPAR